MNLELEDMFFEAFPEEFLRNLLRLISEVYVEAYEECQSSYPIPEAHDLRSHMRRAKLEYQVRELVRNFPDIVAEVEKNKKKTSFYTKLKNKRVVLTISAVNHPNTIVRRAEFRETYARNAQLSLFDPEPVPPPDALLYAILLHGPDSLEPSRPGFINVVFPNKNCKAYVGSIDLMLKFNTLTTEIWSVKEEIVKDELSIKLREDAKQQAEKLRKEQQNLQADDKSEEVK